jgi:HEAT repeat protein/MFS family permease
MQPSDAPESAVLASQPGSRPIDYSGRAIGPLRLARAMLINIMGGCCILMALAILWPNAAITAVFLREQLGASKTVIGLNLTLCTAGAAAALPGAWFFSRLRRRRETWIAFTAGARAIMFAPAIVALFADRDASHPTLILIFIIGLFLVNAGSVFTSPAWWAWMADLIPGSILGSFFGRRYRWMLLAQSLIALAAAVILDRTAGSGVVRIAFFGIFATVAVLAVVDPLLFCLVPEPVRPHPPARTLRDLAREYLEPIRDPAFRGVLIGAGAYGLFYNLPIIFLPLFLRGEQVGHVWIGGRAPLLLLSLVTVLTAAGTAVAANQWGRLADRIGHRTVWVLGSLAYFTYFAYIFINAHNYAILSLAHAAVFGLLFAGQPVAVQNMAISMAPPARREFYMSVFQTVTQVATAIGPLLGGWLADQYRVIPWIRLPSGQPACYIHLLIAIACLGMLLTLPIMVRVPDPRGDAVLPWFGRLVSGDLWRVAYNMGVLASAVSPPRRVRALRRISDRDGNVMLPDITRALDDPHLTVRREALLALGRLGTPEALDLLRWYLHEPDAMMRAPSVEALGHTHIPDRASLLRRALHDPDSRVRRAAAEALAHSGDRDAVEELRRLLADERDGEVLVSVAAALSKLKEFGAVREMLKLALHSANTTVRSQMLVALADLLSDTSDFHKLWREDRQWRGSGFARLARRLRRQARAIVTTVEPDEQRSRAEERRLVKTVTDEVETLLEHVQAERWPDALAVLCSLARQFLRLRYRYRGDDEHALEFISAVAPEQAQRYWLVTYLHHACDRTTAAEAPWDGLTLLALHVLVHGQTPG